MSSSGSYKKLIMQSNSELEKEVFSTPKAPSPPEQSSLTGPLPPMKVSTSENASKSRRKRGASSSQALQSSASNSSTELLDKVQIPSESHRLRVSVDSEAFAILKVLSIMSRANEGVVISEALKHYKEAHSEAYQIALSRLSLT